MEKDDDEGPLFATLIPPPMQGTMRRDSKITNSFIGIRPTQQFIPDHHANGVYYVRRQNFPTQLPFEFDLLTDSIS